jgi:S1-C subfamily serine protease
MRLKALIIGIVALALTACATAVDLTTTATDFRRMEASVVYVSYGYGIGSGVVIAPGYVLTAAHVVPDYGPELITHPYVWLRSADPEGPGTMGEVIWRSERHDLAVVKVDTGDAPVAPVRCTVPALGEQGYIVGHPAGWEWMTTPAIFAQSYAQPNAAWMFAGSVYPGNSGGGFFAPDGALRGIVTTGLIWNKDAYGFNYEMMDYGMVVPSNVICAELRIAGAA